MLRTMRQHGADAEATGEEADQPDAEAGAALAGLDAGLAELLPPDVGVALLDGGELLEDGAAFRVGLGLGEEVVDGDAVDLVVEVGLVAADRRPSAGMWARRVRATTWACHTWLRAPSSIQTTWPVRYSAASEAR